MKRGNRGQIMVVGALLLAVLFVGLALMLNSAIYAENLATQETTSTSHIMSSQAGAEDRLRTSAHQANWNQDDLSFTTRQEMVTNDVDDWDAIVGARNAKQGVAVSNGLQGTTEGVRVSQRTPGDFMPADESLDEYLLDQRIDPLGLADRTNWLVAPGVNTRNLTVGVNRTELKAVDQGLLADFGDLLDKLLTGSDAFWIQLDDGTTTWRVYLFEVQDEGEIATVVTSDDGTETVEGVCRTEGDWATLDFESRELVGDDPTHCPELSFYDALQPHDIYWVGADEVNGTYHFIADKPEDEFRAKLEDTYSTLLGSLFDTILTVLGLQDFTDGLLGQNGSPNPFTTSAVYDVTVLYHYNDGTIKYQREITLTGG